MNTTGFSGNLKVMIVDQADFASISAFASEFDKSFERLDVLVASAGVGRHPYEKTKDGWETLCVANPIHDFLSADILAYTAYKSTNSALHFCPCFYFHEWLRRRRSTARTLD
jgi:NAD(P)-dependent dehydrogenase (short-subunit alcohol dehydrogenase family)